MTDAAIAAMATCAKVAPQLHLPLQSGSDGVLERMARGYTTDDYRALVERLRTAVPGLALSTDIIVGFPGETERDFEATLAMMREVRYDSAFMFKYSRRDHTRAAKWDETADDDEKARRLQAVIALQEEIATEINAGWIGREVEVLVEGPARRPQGWVAGKTAHFKTIVLPAGDARPGDLVRARVADATGHTLIAAR